MDLRLRELRFDERLFALRLADRLADFLLPPFFADAFLREARLFGAMALNDLGLRVRETSSNCGGENHRDNTKNTANTTPNHKGRHHLADYTAQTTLDNTQADTA